MSELVKRLVSGETTGSLKQGWVRAPEGLCELLFSENWKEADF